MHSSRVVILVPLLYSLSSPFSGTNLFDLVPKTFEAILIGGNNYLLLLFLKSRFSLLSLFVIVVE